MLNQVSKESVDLTQQNIEKLKELFPEILTDGNKVDFDMLQTILGEEIDGEKERYSFTWPGKRDAIIGAQQPSKGTLRPNVEKSKNFDSTENLYIEGDNLEVLKLLQKSYNNKVKVIYIDPPYNTGKDFVYKDNFRDGVENYLEQTGQVDSDGNLLSTNSESNGRFHTDWLNMMYPRLKLARNLMSEDGIFLISIDDNECDNLRKICDEIFGESNFITTFIWEKKKKPSFLNKNVGIKAEYIVVYAKNRKESNAFSIETTTEGKKYPFNNAGNKASTLIFPPKSIKFTNMKDGLVKAQDMSKGNIITKLLNDFEIKNNLNNQSVKLYGEWRYSQKMLDELVNMDSEITISNIPFRPNLTKQGGEIKKMHNLLTINHYKIATNEDATDEFTKLMGGNYFDYTKPIGLLEVLLKSYLWSYKNEIILDFFSGTATTAHSLLNYNVSNETQHKFIMVQLPEKINEDSLAYSDGYRELTDIGSERIRRAGEEINNKNQELGSKLDDGFKYLVLDKSNIQEWNTDFDNLEDEIDLFAEVFVEGRKELDVVYEIILKNGLELTLPINSFEVDGKTVYDIAFGLQFVCLADNIDTSIAKAIINKRDEYGMDIISGVVFKDAGFNGNDSEKLNCIQLLKDAGFIEENLQTI